jgi:hypothetical protein
MGPWLRSKKGSQKKGDSMKRKRRVTLAEVCLAWMLLLRVLVAMSAAAQVQAGITTTTVSDTVYSAEGTPATGTVLISWPAFTTAGGSSVPAGSTSVTIGTGGVLSVPLVPNAGSTPMGSYYTVVYHLGDGSVTREYWVVPAGIAGGSNTVKISAIRSTVLPASVAMQTVSKAYVDQAIAAAATGFPQDSSPYVLKAGDTMTGPLTLPGDPASPLQAADKNYVDTQTVALEAGLGQKVSTNPQATQVVTQPGGTQLQVNNLNGSLYAGQYVNGSGNNGIANAAAGADCAGGCEIVADHTYAASEQVAPTTLPNQTQVKDLRGGIHGETYLNTINPAKNGEDAGMILDMTSTQSAPSVLAATGSSSIGAQTLVLTNEALAGGSNTFPEDIQGTVPYFKTTFSALNMTGTNSTVGQHVLVPESQDCFGVGDCLMGGLFMRSSGGFRDDADEGAHPFDLQFTEDSRVFTGTCASGCTTGSTVVQVSAVNNGGTQGEGRYLIDTTPGKVMTAGLITGGFTGGSQASATFAGTNFPVSTFLETAQSVPTQANNVQPGTVTVAIVTSGQPSGFAGNTAALPAASGVACVADQAVADGRPLNFETVAYTVVDGSHLQLTLVRPHASGATVAVGGLCGYGLEQKVDTTNGIRQVFPVVGSTSATSLLYAGGQSSLVGQAYLQSAFTNVSLLVATIARMGGVVTVTTANGFVRDVNGLTLTVQGVADTSYNGSFVVTTTSNNSFTYVQAGPDSTSAGGTVTYLTGGYALYPMAEVESVYNATTKGVDGQFTLAANTIAWAAGDSVEEPHYFQQNVHEDTHFVTQYAPRNSEVVQAGIQYNGNNGLGLLGWVVANTSPVTNYYGNGGTHVAPSAGLEVDGVWEHSMNLQAGEDAVIGVGCNSHGCDKWNSGYDLFQMTTSAGVDRMNYTPQTSTLAFYLRGTGYTFNPSGFTAGTINVGTLNAGTVNGQFKGAIAASSLPLFGASGASHAQGAVPDPGTTGGNTRFLREDGTWANVSGGGGGGSVTNVGLETASLPLRGNLLGEYLLNEGTGSIAHDTSGNGNDATINGPSWEGDPGNATDLNFDTYREYVQVPAALNATRSWQFAMYEPNFGTDASPAGVGYGAPQQNFGGNPSILCGTDATHLCLIASSYFGPKSHRFLAFNTDSTEAEEILPSGWHIVTFLCGSYVNGVVTKSHILYDGAEVGSYVHQGDGETCPIPTSGNYQIGGSTQYGGTWFTGKLAAAWAWNTELTLTEASAAARSALDYIRAKGAVIDVRHSAHQAPMVVGGLDSRTYGVQLPSPAASWINQMQLTDSTYTRVNLGVPGEWTFDACAQFDQTYGSYIGTAGPTVVVIWGGVNDQGVVARRVADNLRCMVTKAKALGAKVVLATEISSYSNQSTAGDNAKNALNTVLRAEAFSWGVDDIADLATDAHLGADGASNNTSCFPDNLHPGPNCEPYVTAIMGDAVNELIGSTESNRHQAATASYQEVAGDRFLDLTGTSAQTVTLPDCTGYTLRREMVNLGANTASIATLNGQVLTGSASVAANGRAVFQPIPGAQATAGCSWERVQ